MEDRLSKVALKALKTPKASKKRASPTSPIIPYILPEFDFPNLPRPPAKCYGWSLGDTEKLLQRQEVLYLDQGLRLVNRRKDEEGKKRSSVRCELKARRAALVPKEESLST